MVDVSLYCTGCGQKICSWEGNFSFKDEVLTVRDVYGETLDFIGGSQREPDDLRITCPFCGSTQEVLNYEGEEA